MDDIVRTELIWISLWEDFFEIKREECGAVMAFLETIDVDELKIYGVGILNRTMKMGVV